MSIIRSSSRSSSSSNNNSQQNQSLPRARGQTSSLLMVAVLSVTLILLVVCHQEANASIGYFENYGWPTYGIVKPFWMTPFSAFPSRSISGYSRKHPMHHGRGLIRNYEGYR